MKHHPVTLFCLPFSGGNTYSYRKIETHLATFITPRPLELPGHGRRMKEPLLTDAHDMAEDLFQQMKPSLSSPYAIYGHSMGTVLGYLVTRKILAEPLPPPVYLFMSGHGAPSVKSQEGDIHLLPDDQFLENVIAYGGIPREVAAEKELMALFVPMMKADFKALAEYTYTPAERFDIPITVMIGTDEDISREDAFAWQDLTRRVITVKEFSGGHFFMFDHAEEIARLISQTLI